jgi:hypothetical protein
VGNTRKQETNYTISQSVIHSGLLACFNIGANRTICNAFIVDRHVLAQNRAQWWREGSHTLSHRAQALRTWRKAARKCCETDREKARQS